MVPVFLSLSLSFLGFSNVMSPSVGHSISFLRLKENLFSTFDPSREHERTLIEERLTGDEKKDLPGWFAASVPTPVSGWRRRRAAPCRVWRPTPRRTAAATWPNCRPVSPSARPTSASPDPFAARRRSRGKSGTPAGIRGTEPSTKKKDVITTRVRAVWSNKKKHICRITRSFGGN